MKHFFDVGANIGQTFTDFLNPRPEFDGWSIWCFEPSPRHFNELVKMAKVQSSRYEIHLCPFGLRGSTCVMPFYLKDDPRGDSFEQILASDHETQNIELEFQLHIAAVGAGEFIRSHTKSYDEIVLKLDCEGSEYAILSELLGYQNAMERISKIFVEWHKIGSTPEQGTQSLCEEYQRIGKPLEQWMF